MKISFTPIAFEDYQDWEKNDKATYKKLKALIKDILRSPFSGIGKPEPLKYELSGCWSRRITDEHRLVYKVEQEEVLFLSCKFHYTE